GIVVALHRGTMLVATPSGIVRAVSGNLRVGTRISMSAGRLTTLGRAHRAVITGVVIRRHGTLTFLSASHHVLLVRTGRTVSTARDTRPAPGSVVRSTVDIDDQGDLDEESEHVVGRLPELE